MKRQVAYWVVLAGAASAYLAMVGWSIPAISSASRGQQVFDLRWTGYDFETARDFIAALPPETRAFYLDVQLPLDTAFPGLFAISIGWTIVRLIRDRRVRLAVLALPIVAASCDVLENLLVRRMLLAGAEALTPELVARASALTQLKAIFSLTSVALVAMLFVAWATSKLMLMKSRRGRSRAPTGSTDTQPRSAGQPNTPTDS